jgi:hypothetical protein
MASKIPTARTALITALKALTDPSEPLDGVHVARTGEWRDQGTNEAIVVENARNIERTPMLGGRDFAERFTIPVRVVAVLGGADLEAVETRMWALVTVVEQTILASGHLGGILVYARPAGSDDGERSGPSDEQNVVAELVLNVECESRSTLAA